MRKRHFLGNIVIAAVFFNITIGQAFGGEGAEKLAALLRPQVDTFISTEPNLNADKNNVEYSKVRFDQEPIPHGGFMYSRAFTFKTPPWKGKLIWSFIHDTQEMSKVVGWQIFAAEGPVSGFSGMNYKTLKFNPPGVTPGYQALFQEIPVSRLQPDTTYIIHFDSMNKDPFDVWISLNIVKDPDTTYQELFSEYADF